MFKIGIIYGSNFTNVIMIISNVFSHFIYEKLKIVSKTVNPIISVIIFFNTHFKVVFRKD